MKKELLSVGIVTILAAGFAGSVPTASADCCVCYEGRPRIHNCYNNDRAVRVGSESELRRELEISSKSLRVVRLTGDISLGRSIKVKAENVELDLNGHTLRFENMDVQITVGKEPTVIGQKSYKKWVPGKWVKEKCETRTVTKQVPSSANACTCETVTTTEDEYKEVWKPGHYKTKWENVYDHHDNIDFTVKNGTIEGATGFKACRKEPGTFTRMGACGHNGRAPRPLFKLISGNLRFEHMEVFGADGSDGGDGTYSSSGVFFGRGDGGDGGNGGDGGRIYDAFRGTVVFQNSRLVPGRGGRGGDGGAANFRCPGACRGNSGCDGKPGIMGTYNEEKVRIYNF